MNRVLLSSRDPEPPEAAASAHLHMHATPLFWVWTTVIGGLLFLVLQTVLAVRVPTLGITLAPAGSNTGLAVTQVYPDYPADKAGLQVGDIIVAITDATYSIALRDDLTLNDPDLAGSYATLVAFQHDIREVSTLMSSGPVQLQLADGRSLEITAQDRRPLKLLPGWYWSLSIMGIVALAIGVALKAHTPDDANTTLVLVAAIGFWLTAWSWPLYGPRELAVPLPDLLGALESINHLGFIIMIASALALLWQYPVRLGRRSIWPLTFGIGAVIWCVIALQLYEFPLHAFYVPLFCMPLMIAIPLASTQWWLSKNRPLEKASLRWLLISMFGSTCGAFAMYVVPPLYGAEPLTPPWASQLILLIFFLGLALGAARYRLFDVERWWINTWLWFGMGVAIILIDVALISFLQLGATGSTVLAVVAVAWVYFPLRQRIWQLVAPSQDHSAWQLMPQIASRFSQPLSTSKVVTELGQLFESIFDAPDSVVLQTRARDDKPRLTQHGLNMVIPAPHAKGQVLLSGKHRGRRLFDRADLDYAHNVVKLVTQLVDLAHEHEAVERTERERIMRDLHDDVGARLLSLVHGTHNPDIREEAADLLQTLRTSVIPLHNRQTTLLIDAASDWRIELQQRTARAGVKLQWQEVAPDTVHLSARHYVNLTRILRELLTNALKHAHPARVWITVDAAAELTITFAHDGLITHPDQWVWGRGQHNLANRAHEIRGGLQFTVTGNPPDQQLEVVLKVQL